MTTLCPSIANPIPVAESTMIAKDHHLTSASPSPTALSPTDHKDHNSVNLPNIIHVIAPSNLGGLGVFASHDIPERSTILIDRPGPPLLHQCQSCGGGPKTASSPLTRCGTCYCVWYCSDECRSRDMSLRHGNECDLLKLASQRAHPALRNHVIEAEKSLLCAWVTVVQEASRGFVKGQRLIDKRFCFSNNEQDRPARELYSLLPDVAKALYTPIEFIALVRMFNTNIFENGVFYFTISRINHSCVPNAIQVNGIVQSLVPIKKGEEIVINYLHGMSKIFSSVPAALRRIYLLNQWRFLCNCPSCHVSASSPRTDEMTNKATEATNAPNSSPSSGSDDSPPSLCCPFDVASQWSEGLSHGFLCPSTKCQDHPLIVACRKYVYGKSDNLPPFDKQQQGGEGVAAEETEQSEQRRRRERPLTDLARSLDPRVYKEFTLSIRKLLDANTRSVQMQQTLIDTSSLESKEKEKENNKKDSAVTIQEVGGDESCLVGPPPLFIPTQLPFGANDVTCCRCGGSMRSLFGDAKEEEEEEEDGHANPSTRGPLTPAHVRKVIWQHVLKYLEARQNALAEFKAKLAEAEAATVLETDDDEEGKGDSATAAKAQRVRIGLHEGDLPVREGAPTKNNTADVKLKVNDAYMYEHNPISSHRLTASWVMSIAMRALPQLKSPTPDYIKASHEFSLPLGPSATLLDPTQFNISDFFNKSKLYSSNRTDVSAAIPSPSLTSAAGPTSKNNKKNKNKAGAGKKEATTATTSTTSSTGAAEPTDTDVSLTSVFDTLLENVYGSAKSPVKVSTLFSTRRSSSRTTGSPSLGGNGTAPSAKETAEDTSKTCGDDMPCPALFVPLLPPLLGILPTNAHWLRLTICLDDILDRSESTHEEKEKQQRPSSSSASSDLAILSLCRLVAAMLTSDLGLISSICRSVLAVKLLDAEANTATTPQTSEGDIASFFDSDAARRFLEFFDSSFGTSFSLIESNEKVLNAIIQISNIYDHSSTYFAATIQSAALASRPRHIPFFAGKPNNASTDETRSGAKDLGDASEKQKSSSSGSNIDGSTELGVSSSLVSNAFGEVAAKELISIMISAGKVI